MILLGLTLEKPGKGSACLRGNTLCSFLKPEHKILSPAPLRSMAASLSFPDPSSYPLWPILPPRNPGPLTLLLDTALVMATRKCSPDSRPPSSAAQAPLCPLSM